MQMRTFISIEVLCKERCGKKGEVWDEEKVRIRMKQGTSREETTHFLFDYFRQYYKQSSPTIYLF